MKNLKVLNLISIALALVTIILMFVPFWTYTDGDETVSTTISQLIWTPSSYKPLQKFLKAELDVKDLNLNTPALTIFACLFFSAYSIFALLKDLKGTSGCAISLILGFFNVWGFIRVPMLHMNPIWIAYPVMGVLLIVLNISGVIQQIRISHQKAISIYV